MWDFRNGWDRLDFMLITQLVLTTATPVILMLY